MKALFKEKNNLIINSADSNEQMLLESFVENAKEDDVVYTRLLDINGDICGMAIEIKPKTVEEIVNGINEENEE